MSRTAPYKKAYLEILDRDSYTCQFCHAQVPDVTLECLGTQEDFQQHLQNADYFILACLDCAEKKPHQTYSRKAHRNLRDQVAMFTAWQLKSIEVELHPYLTRWLETSWNFPIDDENLEILRTCHKRFDQLAIEHAVTIAGHYYLVRNDRKVTPESVRKAWKSIYAISQVFHETDEKQHRKAYKVIGALNKSGMTFDALPFVLE